MLRVCSDNGLCAAHSTRKPLTLQNSEFAFPASSRRESRCPSRRIRAGRVRAQCAGMTATRTSLLRANCDRLPAMREFTAGSAKQGRQRLSTLVDYLHDGRVPYKPSKLFERGLSLAAQSKTNTRACSTSSCSGVIPFPGTPSPGSPVSRLTTMRFKCGKLCCTILVAVHSN